VKAGSAAPARTAPAMVLRIGARFQAIHHDLLTIGVGTCLLEGIIEHERPLDLLEWDWRVALALALVGAGVVLGMAAIGSARAEGLRTGGVYALCRRPAFLAGALAYAGFSILLDDDEFWYVGAAYFALIALPVALKEDADLRARFPGEHAEYRERTPLVLPLGRPRLRGISWSRALRRGWVVAAAAVALLAGVELMARLFRPGVLGGKDPPDSPIGIVR